jgi:hypothetical protein
MSSSGSSSLFLSANLLTTGEEAFPRELAISTSVATATGQIRVSYFTARRSASTTQVRMVTGATVPSGTPTVCRIGLWRSAADGSASALVASTAHDATLFAAASTTYTRSWSTPFTTVAGQRYAIGALLVTAGTCPSFLGATGAAIALETGTSPALAGVLTSQADLPDTFTSAVAGTGAGRPYAVIL